ncbi:endonuclease/exonuclease/phosphatase family protein [Paraburkholderia phymatum]|uniref:Endonuclease/exonuclease/phosphatase family protein n=1 Tax=Paraburkholderia phymatum TaxID=148447 RepID=A0ACC6U5C9_9BURK
MSWATVGPLVFVWWNTSLSPPVPRRKATEADLEFVVTQLRELREEVAFDVLALGEVCSADLDAIVEGLGDPNLSVHDATDRTNRLMFDTAVIYDHSKLTLESSLPLTDKFGRKTLKTGEALGFRLVETDDSFVLVASHWPSRLTAADASAVRAELGTALRRFVERMHAAYADPFVVLVGDYNDDPFSPSLANHLLATRDRALARRDSRFLYNPFWRKIGQSHDSDHADDARGFCGTHFYSGGENSQWFTYDQIMFSSAFLQDKSLSLRENLCGIVARPDLRARLLSRREIFDHLPVLGTVELRSES